MASWLSPTQYIGFSRPDGRVLTLVKQDDCADCSYLQGASSSKSPAGTDIARSMSRFRYGRRHAKGPDECPGLSPIYGSASTEGSRSPAPPSGHWFRRIRRLGGLG